MLSAGERTDFFGNFVSGHARQSNVEENYVRHSMFQRCERLRPIMSYLGFVPSHVDKESHALGPVDVVINDKYHPRLRL
jgi:hypothetical protein